ncbi:hypothetical protein [Profundibacter sp.]
MKRQSRHYLPGVLAYIAEEIGEDVAVDLAVARGGREVYIPRNPKLGSELSKIVGLDAAVKLNKLLGSGNLLVPCGSVGGAGGRRTRIIKLLESGMSHANIAAEVDVHTRTVERVAETVKDIRQPKLPF